MGKGKEDKEKEWKKMNGKGKEETGYKEGEEQ